MLQDTKYKPHLLITFLLLLGLFSSCALPQTNVPTRRHSLEFETPVNSFTFSPDGSMLAVGFQDGSIELRDAAQGAVLQSLSGHAPETADNEEAVADEPASSAITSSAEITATESVTPSNEPTSSPGLGQANAISMVRFSLDGETLASASADGTVKLWRVTDGELLRTLDSHEDAVSALAFSPDGDILASASWDTTVHLTRLSDGELLHTLNHYPHKVNSVAFSPDGNQLASVAGSTLYFWQVADGGQFGTAEDHTSAVWDVAFAPDGETLVTVSEDMTARFWQTEDGLLLNTIEISTPARAVVYDPEGSFIIVATSTSVGFWHVAQEGEEATPFEVITGQSKNVALSPTRNLMATTNGTDLLRIWNVPSNIGQ